MGSNNTFEKIKVMLKKEFSKKDVNRARNLIMGKTGASTGTQIGYNKETKEYKEGDVWTEGRKTWTIKNGIKQTVSKLDKIRKETLMPLCCPKCGNVMKKRLDKPNYKLHKKCHDCVVEFEHKLRIKGKYNQYRKDLINKNR
jgi:bacterioferritin-associated ferredoxin